MQTDNYKKRADDLRRSARANLREIRQERIAKRSALFGVDRPDPVGTASGNADQEEGGLIECGLQRTQDEAQTGSLGTAGDVVSLQEADDLDALASKNAAMIGEEPASIEVTTEIPVGDLQDVDNKAEQVQAQSDLSHLPGAGPGLIWMLQKCGIGCLADLAQADPSSLTEQLGVVGQILNVEGWIDRAGELTQMQQ